MEASAEERETLGFISMMTILPVSGSTANCTLEPPVSTPISRKHAIEASRISWYSLSLSVSAGATVIESPVWMPMGSTFSMEQTMMQLSARSRTTSISNSFQPSTILDQDFGDRRCAQAPGDDLFVFLAVVGDAAAGAGQGEGRPDDRRQAHVRQCGQRLLEGLGKVGAGAGDADLFHGLAKQQAVLGLVDDIGDRADHLDAVWAARTPLRSRVRPVLRPVCPPMVGSSASGFSRSMILATTSGVIGST